MSDREGDPARRLTGEPAGTNIGTASRMVGAAIPQREVRYEDARLRRLIGSSPNQIIAKGADWRFLQEFKRELKI